MIYVGISGWNYHGWRGNFYPADLSHKDELYFVSRQFPSIEINGTFYSLKNKEIYKKWYQDTPDDFIFSVKANRYITHIKKLNSIRTALEKFLQSGIEELQEKLGPILWQFPPAMNYHPERWDEFLKLLPKNFEEARKLYHWKIKGESKIRHAVEIRNNSFYDPLFIQQLRNWGITLVFSDNDGRWPYMEDLTGDFVYLRLHGHKKIYESNYGHVDLTFWKKRINTWARGHYTSEIYSLTKNTNTNSKDVYVYFDNDAKVYAPYNAKTLIQMLEENDK